MFPWVPELTRPRDKRCGTKVEDDKAGTSVRGERTKELCGPCKSYGNSINKTNVIGRGFYICTD